MLYAIFLFLSVYLLFLVGVIIGILKRAAGTTHDADDIPSLTVVIPFRNEASHLPRLIACLKSQDCERFRIILVDDHSDDGGTALALRLIGEDVRFQVIPSASPGKKAAITTGVHAAAGEVIVTTDADCSFGTNWLTSVGRRFARPGVRLAFGGVVIENDGSLFSTLQQMEFSTVMATGFAAAAVGAPLYCNGANMAYRRSDFLSLHGFEGNDHIASGDDQYMLEKLCAKYPDGLAIAPEEEAWVFTRPQPSLSAFFHQRLRWAAKWKYGKPASKIVAVLMVVAQIMVIAAWYELLMGGVPILLWMLGAKAVLEFVIIYRGIPEAATRPSFFAFLLLQLVYPPYVVAVGVMANFVSFRWKGRSLRR